MQPMLVMAQRSVVGVALGVVGAQLLPVCANRGAVGGERSPILGDAGGVAGTLVRAKLPQIRAPLLLGAEERAAIGIDRLDVLAERRTVLVNGLVVGTYIPAQRAQVFALGRIGAGGGERERG